MIKEHFGQKTLKNFWSLRGRRTGFAGLIMGVAMLASGSGAQAALLGLTLAETPDIFVNTLSVSYDAGTQSLDAVGVASTIDLPPVTPINLGSFTLDADVDNAGNLVGGTVLIEGDGFTTTLLTGDLTAFGFDASGNLEFTFDVTGGDYGMIYGGMGANGGIIMAFTGSTGDFSSDWSGSGAVADVAPVPLPAAAWLFGSALIGLAGVARRRTRA